VHIYKLYSLISPLPIPCKT